MTPRRQKLVIDVEDMGGLVAPIYAMTEEIQSALFAELARLGWRVLSYGDETEGGSFKAFPDHRTPAEKAAARAEGAERAAAVLRSLNT